MSKRLTFSRNGEWGIEGVDLAALPPKAYGALCKLKNLEGMIEKIASPSTPNWEVEDLVAELVGHNPLLAQNAALRAQLAEQAALLVSVTGIKHST